eukprot:CAMPEP_0178913374 /NCGR_PEP_ID=MMETSP0786-20121207/10804_1 /TAXON_ID=186022 /ORGANISM="Thalassionema frauenfeldii, Strain CCMP 1798" /LENGTH=686 /DNA_ID=CAMNT_0020586103 /DNA_START=85 /DNA_END=2146 /DNA_ORIENTATION=+
MASLGNNDVRRRIPIDECLYGPSRVCPPETWDAVIGDEDCNRGDCKVETEEIDDLLNRGGWSDPENSKSNHCIVLPELRRVCSQGLEGDFRAVAWRVLLELLPLDTSQWKETLIEKRKHYRSLVEDVFVDPELGDGNELRGHHGKRTSAQASLEYHTSFDSLSPNKEQQQAKGESVSRQPGKTAQKELCFDSISANTTNRIKISRSQSFSEPSASLESYRTVRRSKSIDDQLLHINPDAKICAAKQREILSNYIGGKNMYSSYTEDLKDNNVTPVLKTNDSFDDSKSQRSQESLADIVPTYIQEEWKKTGRDIQALDGMSCSVNNGMNKLLVNTRYPSEGETPSTEDAQNASSTDEDKKWYQFFENASLLDEIRKDVVRTHPELYFFLEPKQNLGQRRYAALERILFVWAGLNKGVRYVQGMNEIVGTIYYVLANDESEQWACEAEADTYFMFNTLMSEMRDIFVPDLDMADTGIQGRISNMTSLLSLHDPEVRCHLVDLGIDPAYYAIRWLTTLLSREFLLPDTIRLWDSMFSSTHKDNFMRYVCVTMVMIIRDELLKGDFSTCLRLLQSYPTTNIESLLESSRSLWIYESQVTLACHKGGISLHQALCTITPPPSLVMAYGLPGGVAQARRAAETSPTANSRTGGGFFSRANAMLVNLVDLHEAGLKEEIELQQNRQHENLAQV